MLNRLSLDPNNQKLIYAEELITQIFCKLTPGITLKVCECESNILDDSDDLFGQFPVLILKHFIIPRRQIIDFWRTATGIDSNLKKRETNQIKLLNSLIQDRLGPILKQDEMKEECRMTLTNKLCTMFMPSISKQQRLRFEHEFLAFTSPEAKSLEAQNIYKELSRILGDKPTFFGDKASKNPQISSLDIVAYAYLKREIVNVPHVGNLKNY